MDSLFGDISVAKQSALFGDLTFAGCFEAFWKSGPWRKIGKSEARTGFLKTVTTMQDWIDIQQARDNYRQFLQDNPWCSPVFGERWFRPKKDGPYWRKFVTVESKHGSFERFVK